MTGKKVLKMVLLACLCIFFAPKCVHAAATVTPSSTYTKAAENDRLELLIDSNNLQLKVKDKQTGKTWSSSVSDESFDINSINRNFQKKVRSPIEISYTDLKSGYGAVLVSSLEELKFTAKTESIENGIRISYDLKLPQVKFTVEYRLLDDGLNVTIPEKGFDEYGKYAVTSIRVLPYFLSAKDTTKGFYFYPDGSGAVMDFEDISHFGEKEMTLNVYNDPQKYESMLGKWEQGTSDVMLPVFGAAMGDDGVLAVIDKGAEASWIKVLPTNAVVPVNRINGEFIYRRSFADQRVKDQAVAIYDDNCIKEDRSISYLFLDKGKNTYSDMAVRYRNYLQDNENLKVHKDDKVNVSLDLFMGIPEKEMIASAFHPVTTLAQSEEILKDLDKKGVKNTEVQLKGWMKDGYGSQPEQFPVGSKIGGDKQMKELLSYAKKEGVSVSLIADMIEARSTSGGFSQRNDVTYLGNKTILTDAGESIFLLNPFVAGDNFKKFLGDAGKYDLAGIQLETLGRYLPYNYNDKGTATAKQTQGAYEKMMEKVSDTYKHTTTEGGNLYAALRSDKVTGIPDTDSGFQLTTKSVPFYQIVFHGSVLYTGTAGNLTSDLSEEKLKWIELGYVPYYELTYDGSEKLMNTEYSRLFTSGYKDWSPGLADIYKEFADKLQGVWNETIDGHEEVADGVYKVTYSNKTVIYVNYNDQAVDANGVHIDAKNYVIKEAGA